MPMSRENSRSCHRLAAFLFDARIRSESTIKANEVNPPDWVAPYHPASIAPVADIGKRSWRAHQCPVKELESTSFRSDLIWRAQRGFAGSPLVRLLDAQDCQKVA